jgi:hypothetical protein
MTLVQQLDELLRGHGLATVIDHDAVRIPALSQSWRPRIVREMPHSIQLDVAIELWPGRTVLESVVGLGTGEPASADAIKSFAAGPFHALLEAFGIPQGDQVTREHWTIGGRDREVVLGPVNVRGKAPETIAWFPALQAFLEASDLTPGLHWIRAFHAASDGKRVVLEVLRDNVPWPEAAAALDSAPWPIADGFVSVRTFLVVRGGVDITQVAALMVELDDEAVIARLVAENHVERDARLAVAFLPLAFGRALLGPLGVELAATAMLGDVEIVLAGDPLYRAAAEHATQVHESGPSELFRALALRSAEVSAVNQALNAGSQAADLVLSPPMISLFLSSRSVTT